MHLQLHYEDMDGRESTLGLVVNFACKSPACPRMTFADDAALANYPHVYTTAISTEQASRVPRRVERSLPKFSKVFDLDLKELVMKLVMSLQGDDEADGGKPTDMIVDEGGDWDAHDVLLHNDRVLANEMNSGSSSMDFQVLKQWVRAVTLSWPALTDRHFEQGKAMGYRPGLTNVSDHWVSWLGTGAVGSRPY